MAENSNAQKDSAGFISKRVLEIFNKILPPLSRTEKEALEAGTVGWDGELFTGKPDWNKLLDLPASSFTAEEQAFLDGPVEELCRMVDDWELSRSEDKDVSPEIWDHLKKNGFLGLEIPKKHGGLGFSALLHSTVVMKVASRSFSAAINVMVPNSLGSAVIVQHYGTEKQKKDLLPKLASGELLSCFALTEPHAGSDATSMQTTGHVYKDDQGDIRVNIGNIDKRYITLAPIADLVGMAVNLVDKQELLGKGQNPGISVALIPRNAPGLEIGNRHDPMGVPFQNGPIKGAVDISIDEIVGGPEGAGMGWKMLVEQLSVGRALSLPAVSTAGNKLASVITGDYSRVRRQFGTPIGMFEGVEEPMARIAGKTYIADAARTATVQMVDNGEKPGIPSAILKYHLTENMRESVRDAMDILGGKAIIQGPQNLLGQLYKGIPIGITVEGANIMTRNLIIYGQGGVRAHPHLLKELDAAGRGDAKALTRHIRSHVFNALANAGRSFFLNVTNGHGSNVPVKDKNVARYYRHINRLSASFNLLANATLALVGGDVKRKERLSARMGDVLSHMYLCSTVLRHYEMKGRPKEDLPLVRWACTHSLNKASEAMDDLLRNYPGKVVKYGLRALTMPRLRGIKKPTDRMDREVARTLYNNGPVRDRLTENIYLPGADDADNPLYRLAQAYEKTVAAEPVEKKIREGLKSGALESAIVPQDLFRQAADKGVISAKELESLQQAEKARAAVINVDDFPPVKRKSGTAAAL